MIIIEAKRWFAKTYGNTYHSVSVFQDSKLLGRIDFKYGYGESYLQSAHEILAKNGIFNWNKTKELQHVKLGNSFEYDTPIEAQNHNEAYHNFLMDMREHRENYHVTVNDVPRKKDL